MTRYVIKTTTGEIIGYAFNVQKANKIAARYEYECANQDIPTYPLIRIEKETIK